MSNVLLIIQLIISIILTGLILIQRSEGGALGIGGGGGGGFMSGRAATNSIARMTGILGAAFIVNCLFLSIVFNLENKDQSLIDDRGEVSARIEFQEPNSDTPDENLELKVEDNNLGANSDQPLTSEAESVDSTIPSEDENIKDETVAAPESSGQTDSETP